jgi:hypothetical protein
MAPYTPRRHRMEETKEIERNAISAWWDENRVHAAGCIAIIVALATAVGAFWFNVLVGISSTAAGATGFTCAVLLIVGIVLVANQSSM